MEHIFVSIVEWDIVSAQVEMRDNNGNKYYLHSCTPENGLDVALVQPIYIYNTHGQLIKNQTDMGMWVLHSNDKKAGVLNPYGSI